MGQMAISAPAGAYLPGLALALAIGLLLGAERGWRLREEEAGGRVAGIRTFALLGLLGGFAGIGIAGPAWALAVVLVIGAIAALLLGYAAEMRRDNNVSATRHDIHAELVRFVGRMDRIRTETRGGRGLELERRATSLLISADVDAHVRDSTDGASSKPADSPDGGTAAAEERRS